MTHVTLIYGTTSGNTERLARIVRNVLERNQMKTNLINVEHATKNDVIDSKIVIFGCSTWTGGQLQEDFIPFERQVRKLDLKGKQAAVFGSGDSMFREFARAVDMLENTLLKRGASLLVDSIKLDESKGDPAPTVRDWAHQLAKSLQPVNTQKGQYKRGVK